MDELTEADFEHKVCLATGNRQIGARKLYEAYREAVGGIAYNGEKLPTYDDIKWRARWGWVNAYDAAQRILSMRGMQSGRT